MIRISLKDGTYHEDVGFGCAENRNKGLAIENAKKEAVSDARKRALRLFGNHLGNCLYDKEYVKKVRAEEKAVRVMFQFIFLTLCLSCTDHLEQIPIFLKMEIIEQ